MHARRLLNNSARRYGFSSCAAGGALVEFPQKSGNSASEVRITGIADHGATFCITSCTPSLPPPEQTVVEHDNIGDVGQMAAQDGDALQPVRGNCHFVPVTRHIALGNIQKLPICISHQHSHTTLLS